MAQYELEDMSRYQMADRILFEDFKRYYELKQLTRNSVVLGQFVELRLRDWLREHAINRIYRGHTLHLGTGTICGFDPDQTRQCDLILYEALPGIVRFRQGHLVVVEPEAVWAIIEVKSDIGHFDNAIMQVRELRDAAPDALIYLFARASTEKETIIANLKALPTQQFPVQSLADAIVLVEKHCIITIDRSEQDIERAIHEEGEPPQEVIDEFKNLAERTGLDYDELVSMPVKEIFDWYDYPGTRPPFEHTDSPLKSATPFFHKAASPLRQTVSLFTRELMKDLSIAKAEDIVNLYRYRQTVSTFLGKLIEDLEGIAQHKLD